MKYNDFLKSKNKAKEYYGLIVDKKKVNPILYDFQKDIVLLALKKGKFCIFADCGLGKTLIQLEWAKHIFKHTNKSVLIFAPLAVSFQTIQEGKKIDVDISYAHEQAEIKHGINITNYERIEKFNLKDFSGIVLDESSILKNYSGKYRNLIIEETADIPFKLACTATPCPNDYMELGNHSEFSGSLKRKEMLSTFFIHDASDTGTWRLKNHAVSKFWEWVATWSIIIKTPSDIGYDDNKFILPKLNIYEHFVTSEVTDGLLFNVRISGLQERQKAKKSAIDSKIEKVDELLKDIKGNCLIWCFYNYEADELSKIENSVEIRGSDKIELKEKTLIDFANNKIKCLITKPSIAGFGMNFQNINNMIFFGVNDSYEEFYQALRRCWRYGQKKPVNVNIVLSDLEGSILKNIREKEKAMDAMYNNIIKNISKFEKEEINNMTNKKEIYITDEIKNDNYTVYNGDCVEECKKIKDNNIDYIVFSPPFADLYTYSDNDRDMGNSKNYNEFFIHFDFLIKELKRILKDGRLCTVHCMDIPAMKERDGYLGLKDFPGDIIKVFENNDFIYHSKHAIWKDPLIEVTRTKALGLMYKQIIKDSSMVRAGLMDYLLTFRKKGENIVPIHKEEKFHWYGKDEFNPKEKGIEYNHNVWRAYASPIWMDIRQTNTLNVAQARDEKDEKHICPLQLDTIARAIYLWSNKNDIVFSPFAGIGSEGYQALLMDRRFIGIELKTSYFNVMKKNLDKAIAESKKEKLF